MPHLDCPEEYQARHDQNMSYLKDFQPKIYELLLKHKCETQIGQNDEGKTNIYKNGISYYKNSIEDVNEVVELFSKKPARLLMGRPTTNKKFTEPTSDTDKWPTSAYDDKPDDFHYGRFVSEINSKMEEKGLSIDEPFTGSPYFIVSYGVGTGLHLVPLIKQLKPKQIILADLDVDGIYMTTFFVDWQELTEVMKDLDCALQFTINKNPEHLHEGVKGCIVGNSLMGIDGLCAYMDNDTPGLKQAYYRLMDQKSANMASFVGFLTDEFNMMKNSFRNLKSGNKRILNQCKKKLDKPVLIVGSGPSLEDGIEHVKRLKDSFVIISSGSSMKVLLTHGIVPDFHCNLERSSTIYTRHVELKEEGFDLSNTYAVMTTTIWPGVDSFFKDTVYFIRPALSPVGVFADNLEQVMYNEGPQVTNTAVSFSRRLAAKELYLLGVDLGTSDPNRPRAGEAWKGMRPRNLSIPVRGNKGKTVFTDMQLLQQKDTLQGQIRKLVEVGGKCINLGHGAKVLGAQAEDIEKLELPPISDKAQLVKELFEQFPIYTREKFYTNWNSAVVRESVARFVNRFIAYLNTPGWTSSMIKNLEDLCQYMNKPIREQYPPRLIRGSLLRIMMHANSTVQRAKTEDDKEQIINLCKELVEKHLRRIEMEAYGLADELESEDEELSARLT